MNSIAITKTSSNLTGRNNNDVELVSLCAAAATSTLEVFDGVIGKVATVAVGAGGTVYVDGDILTIAPTGSGTSATFSVTVTAGVVTALTLVTAGSGFVAGQTYTTTTDSAAGSGATITVSTVTDATDAESICKLSCVANTSISQELCVPTTKGLSVRITGASAVGYIYHE